MTTEYRDRGLAAPFAKPQSTIHFHLARLGKGLWWEYVGIGLIFGSVVVLALGALFAYLVPQVSDWLGSSFVSGGAHGQRKFGMGL